MLYCILFTFSYLQLQPNFAALLMQQVHLLLALLISALLLLACGVGLAARTVKLHLILHLL